jgi:hypothetical protein
VKKLFLEFQQVIARNSCQCISEVMCKIMAAIVINLLPPQRLCRLGGSSRVTRVS